MTLKLLDSIKAPGKVKQRTEIYCMKKLLQSVYDVKIEKTKEKRIQKHEDEEKYDWKCPICNFIKSGKSG